MRRAGAGPRPAPRPTLPTWRASPPRGADEPPRSLSSPGHRVARSKARYIAPFVHQLGLRLSTNSGLACPPTRASLIHQLSTNSPPSSPNSPPSSLNSPPRLPQLSPSSPLSGSPTDRRESECLPKLSRNSRLAAECRRKVRRRVSKVWSPTFKSLRATFEKPREQFERLSPDFGGSQAQRDCRAPRSRRSASSRGERDHREQAAAGRPARPMSSPTPP